MNAGCRCWLLLLIAAVDCCCWLLLLIDAVGCCCWLLLLVAGWLLVAAGILLAGWLLVAARILLAGWLLVAAGILLAGWLLVAARVLLAGWLLVAAGILLAGWLLVAARILLAGWLLVAAGILLAGWLLVAAGILLAGQKVFEYFQDIGDLRLSWFCRRKTLWIFSGCWWFAAQTGLQAEKFSIFFKIVMVGMWKRVSPRGSRLVDGSRRMNIMVVHWVFRLEWSRVLSVSGESQ